MRSTSIPQYMRISTPLDMLWPPCKRWQRDHLGSCRLWWQQQWCPRAAALQVMYITSFHRKCFCRYANDGDMIIGSRADLVGNSGGIRKQLTGGISTLLGLPCSWPFSLHALPTCIAEARTRPSGCGFCSRGNVWVRPRTCRRPHLTYKKAEHLRPRGEAREARGGSGAGRGPRGPMGPKWPNGPTGPDARLCHESDGTAGHVDGMRKAS